MKTKISYLWIQDYMKAVLQVLPESQDELGGPLSILRFGKGSNLQYLGTICKLLGQEDRAKLSFNRASLTYWPYENRIPPEGWEDVNKGYLNEEEAGYSQIRAAICAFLSEDNKRANQLFAWADENIDIPKSSLDFNRPGGKGEHPDSGKVLLRQAYIKARRGQFDGVLERVTEAKNIFTYFARKNNKRTDMEYRYQCEVLRGLVEYKLDPSSGKKSNAQDSLEAYKKACPNNFQGIQNYFYIFDFQEAFPDVFEPVLP